MKWKHVYAYLGTTQDLQTFIDQFQESGRKQLGYDVETTSLRWWDEKDRVVGIGLGYVVGETIHTGYCNSIHPHEAFQVIKTVLEDPSTAKIGANIKFDAHWAARYGVTVSALHDVQVMARILRTQYFKVSLDVLIEKEFKAVHQEYHDLLVHAKENDIRYLKSTQDDGVMAQMDPKLVGKYCAADVYWTLRLALRYLSELRQNPVIFSLYKAVEQPLIQCCLDMETQGIRVDRPLLQEMQIDLASQIELTERKTYDIAGKAFNMSSPKEIAQLLRSVGIAPEQRRRKKGEEITFSESYDKRVLNKHSNHPLVAGILKYRTLGYLASTYVDSMLAHNADVLHTSIRQEAARTGRMGASQPNLMGIPHVDEEDEVRKEFSIRKIVLPHTKDSVLICIDENQVEYRLLAHFSGDPVLCDLFRAGKDFHAFVGAQLFNVPMEELTNEQRSIGKKFNFAQLYGAGEAALAEQCKLTLPKVRKLQEAYHKKFPAVDRFKRNTEFKCKHHGGIQNPFGRWRTLPYDLSYRAVNTLIQSTAADIFKISIVRIHKFLQGKKTKILFPVHDELVFNYHYSDGCIFPELSRLMTEFNKDGKSMFRVPLDTEVSICRKNWKEKEELNLTYILQSDLDKRVEDGKPKPAIMPDLPEYLSCT